MKNKLRYGLALSGGGARGIAHIGVLKALEENGIEPSVISGVSMGAIVAAAYGLGIPYDKMLTLIKKEARPLRFRDLNLRETGIFDLDRVQKVFREYAPADDFNALKIPTFIVVTNLNTGRFEIKSGGPFIRWTLASASIPLLFTPQIINNTHYVDGGLTKNMAVKVLKPYCDKTIGVHVNHIANISKFDRIKDIASRVYHLAVYNTILDELNYCDYLIDPPETRNFGVLDFGKADEIFEIGYRQGLQLAKHLNTRKRTFIDTITELRNSIRERLG